MCSFFLWLVLFLEWMSAYFIFYFFTTFPLCNLQYTSLLTTLLKLFSEIILTGAVDHILLETFYWLPETSICKYGSPHVSGFSSSCCCEHPKTVIVMLLFSIFPLDNAYILKISVILLCTCTVPRRYKILNKCLRKICWWLLDLHLYLSLPVFCLSRGHLNSAPETLNFICL